MDKDITVCIVAILLCHLLALALAAMECKPGSLQAQKIEEQSRLKSFAADKVVPDALDEIPTSLLSVAYKPGVAADLGNKLKPTDLTQIPTIAWTANAEDFYTLVAIDLDAPSRAQPVNREYQHWLIGNIRGGNISRGETFSEYKAPTPPVGSGLHRYVFLIFKQPGQVQFREPHIDLSKTAPSRTHFSVREFIKKYSLGQPIAGNYFQAQAV